MYFDNSTLQIPVHPGDDLYYVDEVGGYIVYHVPHAVEAVVLTADNELQVITEIDEENMMSIGSDYFLTFEDAKAWADENRGERPYAWDHDALKWMDTDTWLPYNSKRVYVKIQKGENTVVCAAFYSDGDDGREQGFYDTPKDGTILTGVTAWIDTFDGLDKALEAGEYQMPDLEKCYPYYD